MYDKSCLWCIEKFLFNLVVYEVKACYNLISIMWFISVWSSILEIHGNCKRIKKLIVCYHKLLLFSLIIGKKQKLNSRRNGCCRDYCLSYMIKCTRCSSEATWRRYFVALKFIGQLHEQEKQDVFPYSLEKETKACLGVKQKTWTPTIYLKIWRNYSF